MVPGGAAPGSPWRGADDRSPHSSRPRPRDADGTCRLAGQGRQRPASRRPCCCSRPWRRTYTWTTVVAEVERERTRQIARIGNNLNQIACSTSRRARASTSHRSAGRRHSARCATPFHNEHGYSLPDDPARARIQQPGHRADIDATKLRAGLAVEAGTSEVIQDDLAKRVEYGNRPERRLACTASNDVDYMRHVCNMPAACMPTSAQLASGVRIGKEGPQ